MEQLVIPYDQVSQKKGHLINIDYQLGKYGPFDEPLLPICHFKFLIISIHLLRPKTLGRWEQQDTLLPQYPLNLFNIQIYEQTQTNDTVVLWFMLLIPTDVSSTWPQLEVEYLVGDCIEKNKKTIEKETK